MTTVKVEDLVFGYGDRHILKGVDIVFDRPGLSCILGPNGVGKTTLVKCICKLLEPVSGRVLVDGEDVRTMRHRDLAKKVAFVPNSESSVFAMTVSEAVLMGRHPRSGWSVTEEDMAVVEEMIGKLGLSDYADRGIDEISAGQLQRVMIARGLAQEPEVLILDEPTSNLDVKYQMDVMRFLRRYTREKNIMVIMVCHDLNIAAAYADRVILMDDGKVFADGKAGCVLTEKNVREVYGVESQIVGNRGFPHVMLLPETDVLPEPQPYCDDGPHAPAPPPKSPWRRIDRKKAGVAIAAVVLLLGGAFLAALASNNDTGGGKAGATVGSPVSDAALDASGSRLWVFGNADMNDRMDENDITYLEKVLDGVAPANALCDVDCSGKVDRDDLAYLKRIISAMGDGSDIDVYYVDNYFKAAKVSWPVKTIAIGYCSGLYVADLAGLLGKVSMVDTTIMQYWAKYYDFPLDISSYGDGEEPNYESLIKNKIDVYVPGYCSTTADSLSASALNPVGIDVMFVNTCDNSGIDIANEYIDRSIVMFAFLLQGDMDKTYAYLGWYDSLYAKMNGYTPTDKAAMVMARNCSIYNNGTYSITGHNNTNNIHAEWANIHAVGQNNPSLPKNYNNLGAESVLSVIKNSGFSTVYYVDNEHDGTRQQYSLETCVNEDKKTIKDDSVTIHYLGIAREVGNSPLYILEMAFYQNIMYGNGSEVGNYEELFNYYFNNFSSCKNLPDISHFFYDGGVS